MKRILFAALLALASLFAAAQPQVGVMTIMQGATATGLPPGVPSTFPGVSGTKTYQASGTTSSGSGAAVVAAQCSNDASNWDTLGTIGLTLGTTTTSNSFVSVDRCKFVRANVISISGTGAAVTFTMAY